MALRDLIAAIEDGPKGPQVGAFFDFDGTLIDGYSATAYFVERLRRRQMTVSEAAQIIRLGFRGDMDEAEFAGVIERGLALWAGVPEDEIAELWARLFRERIAQLVYPEAWALVKAHQRMGHTVAVASSATRYQVAPLARELGIENLLCTRAEVREGRLTGGLEGAPFWGTGKADAVRAFAQAQGITLSQSYGYANGNEDIAFLKSVGRARAVNPKRVLTAMAHRQGWPVVHFERRRGGTVAMRARSVAAYGALAGLSLAGMAFALSTGRKRTAAEWVGARASDAMLAITGIHVEVQGKEHLPTQRPALFVFNHQSVADGYVLLTLLRGGFTGVVNQEAARFPLLGRILRGLDFAFIDRRGARGANDAPEPVVERLRRGLSVVIAPEETRSLTPRPGPFTTGAFHIAMEAGAPVVPLVIRNTGKVLPRGSLLFRPGTVEVRVLPPIDPAQWHADALDREVSAVEALFRRTLDDWPEARGALIEGHPAE